MNDAEALKTLDELARETGKYPVDAFNFVREGLKHTVQKSHGESPGEKHISGQDLCWGLRDLALKRWGLLAPVVLRRWNISNTLDFGQIVYSMVEAGWMAKKDEDNLTDFSSVYEFRSAFDGQLAMEQETKGSSSLDD